MISSLRSLLRFCSWQSLIIQMSNPSWRYFLALESDVEKTTRYVEPCADNSGTYSVEFARLLLATCAEVEVVAKELCAQLPPLAATPLERCAQCGRPVPRSNMDLYRQTLATEYKHLHSIEILVPSFSLSFSPWSTWPAGKNPDWWVQHQAVKHDRGNSFRMATLDRCFNAAAALLSLLAYRHQVDLFACKLEMPKLFALKTQFDSMVSGNCELPDFDSNGNRIP